LKTINPISKVESHTEYLQAGFPGLSMSYAHPDGSGSALVRVSIFRRLLGMALARVAESLSAATEYKRHDDL